MKTVWYVVGADPDCAIPVLFATKMAAEIYARQVWPDADPSARYARVMSRYVWEEADMGETSNEDK